jgi:hypothetical protein
MVPNRPRPRARIRGTTAREVDRAPLHDVDSLLEVLSRQRGQWSDLDDSGDVHGDLDRPELVLDAAHLLLDEHVVADVAHHRGGIDVIVLQGSHGTVQLGGVPRPEHRLEPAPAELPRDQKAEPARTAGNEGDRSCAHDRVVPRRPPVTRIRPQQWG